MTYTTPFNALSPEEQKAIRLAARKPMKTWVIVDTHEMKRAVRTFTRRGNAENYAVKRWRLTGYRAYEVMTWTEYFNRLVKAYSAV